MASDSEPKGCTNFKLRGMSRLVSRHYDAQLAQCGLKTTQYSLLTHVLRAGPVRSVDLARAMHIETSTLARNLQPLISADWIELKPGPDARSHLVAITQDGRKKHAQAQRQWRLAQKSMDDVLGSERVAALHRLMEECTDLLKHALPNRAEGGHDDKS